MMVARNKPIFLRQGWDRYKRLGKKVKRLRKWRAAKGGDSKTRLKENGRPIRPTIGWGAAKETKNQVAGFNVIRIETMNNFQKVTDKKTQAVMIASVGKKKQMEMIKKANEMNVKILNRFRSKQ